MSPATNEVSRRFDRIVRRRRFWGFFQILGISIFLLGAVGLWMTIQYSPEQVAQIVARDPKWFMDPSILFPAPKDFRYVGSMMMLGGLLLVAFAGALRSRGECP